MNHDEVIYEEVNGMEYVRLTKIMIFLRDSWW